MRIPAGLFALRLDSQRNTRMDLGVDYIVFSYQGTTIVCTINTLHEGEAEHNCVIDLLTSRSSYSCEYTTVAGLPTVVKRIAYSHRIHSFTSWGPNCHNVLEP